MGRFDLDALLALAAIFVGLSLAVEVLQDVYKYISSSKARAYRIALRDFLGPWCDKAYGREEVSSLLLRGPFQWLQRQTPARLLPMEKGDLLNVVVRTAKAPVGDAAVALEQEVELQGGVPAPPTPGLAHLIERIWSDYDTDGDARRVFDFLDGYGITSKPGAASSLAPSVAQKPVDARAVLNGLYRDFMPERLTVGREFDQFASNFEHAYKRRNLRQTLVLASVVAIALDLPFDALYQRASQLSPEETIRLAESSEAWYAEARPSQPAGPEASGPDAAGATEPGATREPDPGAGRAPDLGAAQEPDPGAGGAPDPGATQEPDPGAGGASDPGAAQEPDPGAAQEPDPGAADATSESAGAGAVDELEALRDRLRVLAVQLGGPQADQGALLTRGARRLRSLWTEPVALAAHLFNCFVTALFVSFGAPFWHRLSTALLERKRPAGARTEGES